MSWKNIITFMYVYTSKDTQFYISLNETENYVKWNSVVSVVNNVYLQNFINVQEAGNLSTYF